MGVYPRWRLTTRQTSTFEALVPAGVARANTRPVHATRRFAGAPGWWDAWRLFERFTEQARQVIVRAHEEALRLGHSTIDTEHELLALVREQHGVVAEVLGELGITAQPVIELVVQRLGPGSEQPTHGQMPFSPRATKVLELSLREALASGQQQIRPEHLLLGLVREGEGGASQILAALGADAEAIRAHVLARLTGPATGSPSLHTFTTSRSVSAPTPTTQPDELLLRSWRASAEIARNQDRAPGIEDVLLAFVRDSEISQLLSDLGVDVLLLRRRLEEPPPASE